ncbi:hypothetical protein C8Q76DRAFT_419810 [Earliella scabrosa]|nr:hypothetical protein C8Q76DRAFT_419810 [Earliella scabrosa]
MIWVTSVTDSSALQLCLVSILATHTQLPPPFPTYPYTRYSTGPRRLPGLDGLWNPVHTLAAPSYPFTPFTLPLRLCLASGTFAHLRPPCRRATPTHTHTLPSDARCLICPFCPIYHRQDRNVNCVFSPRTRISISARRRRHPRRVVRCSLCPNFRLLHCRLSPVAESSVAKHHSLRVRVRVRIAFLSASPSRLQGFPLPQLRPSFCTPPPRNVSVPSSPALATRICTSPQSLALGSDHRISLPLLVVDLYALLPPSPCVSPSTCPLFCYPSLYATRVFHVHDCDVRVLLLGASCADGGWRGSRRGRWTNGGLVGDSDVGSGVSAHSGRMGASSSGVAVWVCVGCICALLLLLLCRCGVWFGGMWYVVAVLEV